MSGILVTMWRHFSYYPAQIVTHIWRSKAKICSTFTFKFFLKFWTFVRFIQFSFLFSFQKYNSFWNRTKIDVFTMFFPWNYFSCARIPSFLENGKQNVKVLWENFRCHLILWVTMWAEVFSHCDSHCEKIVSGDEYPYLVVSWIFLERYLRILVST